MKKIHLCFLLICFALPVLAQQEIVLHNGNILLKGHVDASVATWQGNESSRMFILSFDRIPLDAEKQKLQRSGVELLEFLPPSGWLARIRKGGDLFAVPDLEPDLCLPFSPLHKIHRHLLSASAYPGHIRLPDGQLKLTISPLGETFPDGWQQDLENSHVSYAAIADWRGAAEIHIHSEDILLVAELPWVKFIEPGIAPAEPENYSGKQLHRTNMLWQDFAGGRKYRGDSVIVAMGDDGIIGPHIDYTGRTDMSRVSSNNGNHGDHVAGTIMGAGNMNPRLQGMAPGATLFVYDVWDAVNSSANDHSQFGVMITSTSYSNGCNAGYTTLARSLDITSHQNPDLHHVFSAGNEGASDCSYGAGAGWGNVTGGIKISKNCITVGNLSVLDQLDGSSSRGPATDGRIKPEICAKGQDVYSTIDPNLYINFTGTSMACPGVSGTTAVLVQAFRELNGNMNPPSALMRGMLMNTAEDLGNPGPDFKHGYGRINARKVVDAFQQHRWLADSVSQNGQNTHILTVPAGAAELRVMICWLDPEGSVLATRPLVNDLDLTLTNPSSTVYQPWVLDPSPSVNALNANAVRGRDSLNNMEQVSLAFPQAGSYTVMVKGRAVPQGPQTYYLMWEVYDSSITLTHPSGGESFNPGEQERIMWDAAGNWGSFDISFSSDSGLTWNVMTTGVPASQRGYTWTVPSLASGKMLVRVTRGLQSDVSDHVFSVMKVPTGLTVSSSCVNYCILSWNAVPGASVYEVSMLGNKYMDSMGTTAQTSFQVNGIPLGATDKWFAVKALLPDGGRSKRTVAINKQPGLYNCPEPDDVSVSNILIPGEGPLLSCAGADSIRVKIRLKNNSPNAITQIPVHYQLQTQPVVNAVFTDTLQAYASADFLFSANWEDLSAPGISNLTAWTSYGSDPYNGNDTARIQTGTWTGILVQAPIAMTFDSLSPCATTANCGTTVCTLGNGFQNILTLDEHDWRTYSFGTPSNNTGPSGDHTSGSGKYVYLEANSCYAKKAYLLTPCFDIAGTASPYMSFWHHQYGADMGELHIDANVEGEWINDIHPPMTGDWFDSWWKDSVNLSQYAGRKFFIRFRGITGNGPASDMALDDIFIRDAAVAVDDGLYGQEIRVFPNPAQDRIRILGSGLSGEATVAELFDVNGRCLHREAYSVSGGLLNAEMEIGNLPSGMYLLKVSGRKGLRLMVMH